MQIVRVATFLVVPGALIELARTYAEECIPLIRTEPGNLGGFLLEPIDDGAPAIACTVWATEIDAARYDESGRGAAIADRVRRFFATAPTLAGYRRRDA